MRIVLAAPLFFCLASLAGCGKAPPPVPVPVKGKVVFADGKSIRAVACASTGDTSASLAAYCAAAGIRVASDDTWSDVFSRVIVEKIEPNLGVGRPAILCEYPLPEAALARPKPGDPRVAERFELYVCGVELANGFGELTYAEEQRRRFEDEMRVKLARYGETYPIDEDFLAALREMPEASGVALGFDRLVMLATGCGNVRHVMWTPLVE